MLYKLSLVTIGHINHGKTSLLKALTSINADRLPQEQEKQITIDLGFAFFRQNNALVSFIDVPGHIHYLSNMLASVHSVDASILVVSAVKGIQEQTKEQLLLTQAANVYPAVCVLTHADLVDTATIEQRKQEIQKLVTTHYLKETPCLVVSSTTEQGIDSVKTYLTQVAKQKIVRPAPFRFIIDRSFTLQGKGTIITGSVISGQANAADSFYLFPQAKALSVRAIQRHGKEVATFQQSDRIAFNLRNLPYDQITRGMQITTTTSLLENRSFYVRLRLYQPIKVNKTKQIRLFSHAQQVTAYLTLYKTKRGDSSQQTLAKITTKSPFIYALQDNCIIRDSTLNQTLACGTILITAPLPTTLYTKQNKQDYLESLCFGTIQEKITSTVYFNKNLIATRQEVQTSLAIYSNLLDQAWNELIQESQLVLVTHGNFMLAEVLERITVKIYELIDTFHKSNPELAGIAKTNLLAAFPSLSQQTFNAILSLLCEKQQIKQINPQTYALASFQVKTTISKEMKLVLSFLEEQDPCSLRYISQSINLPEKQVQSLLKKMKQLNLCYLTQTNLYFHFNTIEKTKKILYDYYRDNDSLDIATWKQITGTSRKKAVALLEYFDTINITTRVNNTRFLQSSTQI